MAVKNIEDPLPSVPLVTKEELDAICDVRPIHLFLQLLPRNLGVSAAEVSHILDGLILAPVFAKEDQPDMLALGSPDFPPKTGFIRRAQVR